MLVQGTGRGGAAAHRAPRELVFSDALAHLVANEIDYLCGCLYRDRMGDGVEPIGVEEYKGTGEAWGYGRV